MKKEKFTISGQSNKYYIKNSDLNMYLFDDGTIKDWYGVRSEKGSTWANAHVYYKTKEEAEIMVLKYQIKQKEEELKKCEQRLKDSQEVKVKSSESDLILFEIGKQSSLVIPFTFAVRNSYPICVYREELQELSDKLVKFLEVN